MAEQSGEENFVLRFETQIRCDVCETGKNQTSVLNPAAHQELQQLFLRALVQVGLLDRHQLPGSDVAPHAHLAQVVEAPPCETRVEMSGFMSGHRLSFRDVARRRLCSLLTQLGQQLVVGGPHRQSCDVMAVCWPL